MNKKLSKDDWTWNKYVHITYRHIESRRNGMFTTRGFIKDWNDSRFQYTNLAGEIRNLENTQIMFVYEIPYDG